MRQESQHPADIASEFDQRTAALRTLALAFENAHGGNPKEGWLEDVDFGAGSLHHSPQELLLITAVQLADEMTALIGRLRRAQPVRDANGPRLKASTNGARVPA